MRALRVLAAVALILVGWSWAQGVPPLLVEPPLQVRGQTPGELRLWEAPANGTMYVGLLAPASIPSSVTWTLPSADGTAGQALVTNGAGALSFAGLASLPGVLTVPQGGTGAATLTGLLQGNGTGPVTAPLAHVTSTQAVGFGVLAPNQVLTEPIGVTAAQVGDGVSVTPLTSPGGGLQWSAYVSTAGVVTIVLANPTKGFVTNPLTLWRADVWHTQ